jgi:hypothetical protein
VPSLGPGASSPEDDPWNFWVFRIGGNGNANGESSFSGTSYSGNLSANRTTEEWKFTLSGRYSRSASEFVISEDLDPIVSLFENWSGTSLLVKSLTPLGLRRRDGVLRTRGDPVRRLAHGVDESGAAVGPASISITGSQYLHDHNLY